MKTLLISRNYLCNKMCKSDALILALIAVLAFSCGVKSVFAQDNGSASYVPLIGISSVPEPLTLPDGPGNVTYHFAVKNFLPEAALTNVAVVDDKCSPVKFIEGDDNHDAKLDFNETWRYECTTKISDTTESIATATSTASGLFASHSSSATVVVGSLNPPPLVNIVNITKVAYPLTLTSLGGDITFTFRVNNPGIVPLGNVDVADDECGAMSGKLGDTNGNNLLDIDEVWIYSCTMHLNQTRTNAARVTAFANGLKAIGFATLTVKVGALVAVPSPNLLDVSISPSESMGTDLKISTWKILLAILAVLIAVFILFQRIRPGKV